MSIFRLTPVNGAPVLRAGCGLSKATARGLKEFPQGLERIEVVPIAELVVLVTEGLPVPLAGRQAVAAYLAVQREKERKRRQRERRRTEVAIKKEEAKEREREERNEARRAAREARARARTREKAAATRAAKKAAPALPINAPEDACGRAVAPT